MSTRAALTTAFSFFLLCGFAGCGSSATMDMAGTPDLRFVAPPDLRMAPPDLTSMGTPDLTMSMADLTSVPDLAGGGEAACKAAKGIVVMALCCNATNDFPNTCLIGACGCAPQNSHMVKVCSCPGEAPRCWDGKTCVDKM